jgi:AraC family transcriptional regulator
MQLEKIQDVIKYIDEHYNQIIPVEVLQDIGCYSYRNLQRVFKNIFNESLGEFQKRLKLENGYKKLIYSSDTITDIAYTVGFESLQAFTKSFKKHFYLSPSEARINKLKVFDEYINQTKENHHIPFEIIYLDALLVYYQTIKTNNYDNNDIDQQWAEIDIMYKNQQNLAYYGVIVDQPLITMNAHCRYEACVNQNPHDKSYSSKYIFGGKYLKFLHYGNYDTIENTYRLIYKNWLFSSKLELDHSPVIEHYVVHDSNVQNEGQLITEILFPLKKNELGNFGQYRELD